MSESVPPASPARSGPSDLVKFVGAVVVVVAVIVVAFLIIRQGQDANSQRTYEECLARSDAQGNPEGFRPEDFCQRPD